MAVVPYVHLYNNFEHGSFPTGDHCSLLGWELHLLESCQPEATMVAEIRLGFLLSDHVALEEV